MSCTSDKVLYGLSILPGFQQLIGLGKIGCGLWGLVKANADDAVLSIASQKIVKGSGLLRDRSWTQIREGGLLFLPLIGTIYAIYKLVKLCKRSVKTNDVKKEPSSKSTEKKENKKSKTTNPTTQSTASITTPTRSLTTNDLVNEFSLLITAHENLKKTKDQKQKQTVKDRELKQAELINEFVNKIKENNSDSNKLIEAFKKITIGNNRYTHNITHNTVAAKRIHEQIVKQLSK